MVSSPALGASFPPFSSVAFNPSRRAESHLVALSSLSCFSFYHRCLVLVVVLVHGLTIVSCYTVCPCQCFVVCDLSCVCC